MEVLKTKQFDTWLRKLRDRQARAIILVHINRLIENNPGKLKPVGNSIFEKKINYGPGYRLYLVKQRTQTIILLCGGDKSTQQQDIEKAKNIASSSILVTQGT